MKENEVVGGVYKITCKPNGKVYIGRSKDIFARWEQHLYRFLKSNTLVPQRGLQNDLMLYGVENFSFEIVEETDDLENQKSLEIKYINFYKSYIPSNGYNRLSDKLITCESDKGKYWGSSRGIGL